MLAGKPAAEPTEDVRCRSLDLAIDSPGRPCSGGTTTLEADTMATVTAMDGAARTLTPKCIAAGAWTSEGQVWNSKVAARYSDKAKGLSLQERMAQLEFSDDEEDAEVSSQVAQPERELPDSEAAAPIGNEPPPQPTVEACEAFVPPSDDEDD
mmetsp:Transcript_87716/g.204088  ORF Transcript_87716/g.204088 Transcript_87716/m.204088 type:complete len:153 (-) Transcript_87716:66-524(-)